MLCLGVELPSGGLLQETLSQAARLPKFGSKHLTSGAVLLPNSLELPGKPPGGGREGAKAGSNRNIRGKSVLIVPSVRTCSDVWISVEVRKVPAKRA